MEIFGVSRYVAVPVALAGIWAVTVFGNYTQAERVFVVMCLVFLAYHAQQRLFSLRTAYDRYPRQADVPPEDYAEFLLRACGVLRHEPSASQRLAGEGIC